MNFHYSALILAAGLGKRMHSDLPKVLHGICGYSLIEHAVFNLQEAGIDSIGIIVGHKHKLIETRLGDVIRLLFAKRTTRNSTRRAPSKTFFIRKQKSYTCALRRCSVTRCRNIKTIHAVLRIKST